MRTINTIEESAFRNVLMTERHAGKNILYSVEID